MTSFWRLQLNKKEDWLHMQSNNSLICPDELSIKLRPKDCIVLSEWDATNSLGKVQAFGVVRSIKNNDGLPEVIWSESDVVLKPNPTGARFWRDKKYFKFANTVRHRYMLDDLLREHFPDLDDVEFDKPSRISKGSTPRIYQEIEGYVYLIKSEYGYKIGKTVNIKNRTQIFHVKLPFTIELIHYARFSNYSKAESDFHRKFADKRLEGEWFDLNDEDIKYIELQGEIMSLEGL